MAPSKRKSNRISLRAGTDLTYNLMRGHYKVTRTLPDVEYMRPEDDACLAISLTTGVTALGDTLDNAYSSLILKLYNYLRDTVNTPGVEIGKEVSEELKNESAYALRMPQNRQINALDKGIKDFIKCHKSGTLFRSKIQYDPTAEITTPNLDETLIPMDAFVEDTCAIAS